MCFILTKGCLYLSINKESVEPFIKTIDVKWLQNRENRDGDNYHITIVNSTENIPESYPANMRYFIIGIKITDNVAFLVLHYPAGDRYRKKHGLDNADFHITLGWKTNDNHAICKSIECLNKEDIINTNFIEFHTLPEKQLKIMRKLYYDFTDDADILAGYINCLVNAQEWETAKSLSFSLLELCPNKGAYALLKLNTLFASIDEKLLQCIEDKLYDCDAIDNYKDYIIENLNKPLLKDKWIIKNGKYIKIKTPRNFTECYNKIFGSAILKNSHMEFLKYKNIGAIINLIEKHEMSIDKELSDYYGKNYYSYPIPDRHIITLDDTDTIVNKIIEHYDNEDNILIHCMGGKGRTNMIIACFAIKKLGLTSIDVIEHLKNTREFIMSREQTDLIKRYENKLASDVDYKKRDKSFIKFNGKKCPAMIVLVGLPGSGKSTFSNHLLNNVKSIIRVCQDDIGKKSCFDIVSKNISNKNLVIIDRCNLKTNDREDFTNYLKGDQKAWAIVFNTDADECIYRAQHRPEHPTLKPSGAENIIKNLSLEPLTDREKFEQIIYIESPDDLNYILEQWTIPVIQVETTNDIVKFPRTRHLANLGSASRNDLMLDQNDIREFLNNELWIEEKIDGANMGISIDPVTYKIIFQNRSHYITSNYAAQFKKLDMWRDAHLTELFEIIEPGRHILYGEWVFSKHSIHYTHLPGYFIAFDLYDKKTGKFSSRKSLESLLQNTTIPLIRLVAHDKFKNIDQITRLVNTTSAYYDGKLEGIYVRICDENHTLKRAKIVRNDFICGDTHWNKHKCVENLLV